MERKLKYMRRVTSIATTPDRVDKKAVRMQRAFEMMERRKTAEKSKKNAVQYATAAFAMAMHELYGWSGERLGRVVSSATEKWGSYSKDEECVLIDAAREIGVDLEKSSTFNKSEDPEKEKSQKEVFVTVQTYKHLEAAIKDMHLMMASCLVALHEQYGFGERRLNAVMELMWKKIRQVQSDPNINIMQLCEKETGIRITGKE